MRAVAAFVVACGEIALPPLSGDLAVVPSCMYNACMPNVQVRDVSPEVHEVLVRRAARAGQSLQQYLTAQLARLAAAPTLDEVLDRIEGRDMGTLGAADAVSALEAGRAGR